MSEKLIKESRKVFLHLAELFYEMRINTLKETRPDEVDILTAAGNEYWKGGSHTFMPCYEYLVKSCIVRKCLIEPSELKSFTDNFEITKSTNSDFPEVGEPVTTAKCEVIHLIFSSSSEIPSFFLCPCSI